MGDQRSGEHPTDDPFVFRDHVPSGMEPCPWCCAHQSGLAVMPGYFRDTDVDAGLGKFGVCPNCAGTGCAINLPAAMHDRILVIRNHRNRLAAAAMQHGVELRFAFAVTHIADSRAALDRAIRAFTERAEDRERLGALADANMVAACLWFSAPDDEGHIAGIVGELAHAKNDRVRAALCADLERVRAWVTRCLPNPESPEHDALVRTVEPHVTRTIRRLKELQAHLMEPLLREEVELLGIVREWWERTGRPTGCYAADLVAKTPEFLALLFPRPKRRITDVERARFAVTDASSELRDVTPELLADLHDCVRKFGVEEDECARISLREPTEIHVSVSARRGNDAVIVVGPGAQTREGAYVGTIGGQFPLIWDKRVTVADVERFIAAVDDIMRERGLVDPNTGERQRVIHDVPRTKVRVEDVFAERGTALAVLPGGPDAETMRQEFDHPEQVTILTGAFGHTALCHTRDVAYLKRREEIAARILAAHGYASPEAIGRMPMEQLLAIREEITRAHAGEQPN